MDNYFCSVCGAVMVERPDLQTGTPAFFCPLCEARKLDAVAGKARFLAALLLNPPRWPIYDPRAWLAYSLYWRQLQDLAGEILAQFKD